MCCIYDPDDSKSSFTKMDAWEELVSVIGIALAGVLVVFEFTALFLRCAWRESHSELWSDPIYVASSIGGMVILFSLVLALCPAGVRLFCREVRKCVRRLREPD